MIVGDDNLAFAKILRDILDGPAKYACGDTRIKMDQKGPTEFKLHIVRSCQ